MGASQCLQLLCVEGKEVHTYFPYQSLLHQRHTHVKHPDSFRTLLLRLPFPLLWTQCTVTVGIQDRVAQLTGAPFPTNHPSAPFHVRCVSTSGLLSSLSTVFLYGAILFFFFPPFYWKCLFFSCNIFWLQFSLCLFLPVPPTSPSIQIHHFLSLIRKQAGF